MKRIQCQIMILTVVVFFACKSAPSFPIYLSSEGFQFENPDSLKTLEHINRVRKSIALVSDSTLHYTVMIHDFGAMTTIKYKIENNLLKVDSVDIYNKKSFQNYTNEIFGCTFSFSKDSLIDLKSGEKYYSSRKKKKR